MPVTKMQVPEKDLDAKLGEILDWVNTLTDEQISTLIRSHIPEAERLEVIPPTGAPQIIYTGPEQSAGLRKTTEHMKVLTDSFKLRNPDYTRDVITEKHIAFTICPFAFIEIV